MRPGFSDEDFASGRFLIQNYVCSRPGIALSNLVRLVRETFFAGYVPSCGQALSVTGQSFVLITGTVF
jgi:hypothetical protein